MAKFSNFFNTLRPYFQNSFVPIFFMFFVLSSRMDHKIAIEKGTPVYNQFKISLKKLVFYINLWPN